MGDVEGQLEGPFGPPSRCGWEGSELRSRRKRALLPLGRLSWYRCSVKIALAVGLTVLAATLAVVLSRAPLRVAGTDGISRRSTLTFTPHDTVFCTPGGTLPAGTQAIRVSLAANNGPRVAIKALSGATVVSEGVRDAGWGVDETVTVAVARVPRTITDARICTTVGAALEPIQARGERLPTTAGHQILAPRMEYLRPGARSWLSLVPAVARHMGLAHAPSGAWVAYLTILAMLTVSVLAARLLLRELR